MHVKEGADLAYKYRRTLHQSPARCRCQVGLKAVAMAVAVVYLV